MSSRTIFYTQIHQKWDFWTELNPVMSDENQSHVKQYENTMAA